MVFTCMPRLAHHGLPLLFLIHFPLFSCQLPLLSFSDCLPPLCLMFLCGWHSIINCEARIRIKFNDQLPVRLLAQLVRALHRYRRGQGSNPGKPDFFQAFFSQLHKLR